MKRVIIILSVLLSYGCLLGQQGIINRPFPVGGGDPVYGDPVSIELLIAVSADDGEENFPDGTEPGIMITIDDPWGEMAYRSGGAQAVYFRFIALGVDPIPQGALIETATIRFRSNSSRDLQCDLRVFIEDVDNSPPFGTADGSVSSRFPFPNGTHVSWPNVEPWTSSGNYFTPELKDLLQPVVNRPGFSTLSAISVAVIDEQYLSAPQVNGRTRVVRHLPSTSHDTRFFITYRPQI